MAAVTVESLQALLAEKTKQYEGKIAALGAINTALQKENDKLRQQAARAEYSDGDFEEELEELRAEFQERLGASDRLIAQLQDEKAKLSAALATANAGGSAAESQVAELQSTVDTLKAEGDALSRKAGDLESTCRKLRSTNKDLEAERDKLQARVKALETQVLEMQEKMDLAAHAATQQVEELERELSETKLDAKKQIAEARRQAQEAQLQAEAEMARGGAEIVAAAKERESALAAQVMELREALSGSEREAANKEDAHRRQLQQLEEQIRQLEVQRDDMAASAGDVTRPLLKQIESMAATATAAADAAAAAERTLMTKLAAAEDAAAVAAAGERNAAGRAAAAEAALQAAREAAAAASAGAAELRARLEAAERRLKTVEAEREAVEERLGVVGVREERLRAESEQQRRELSEKLWDCEQRLRALAAERDQLLQRVETWSGAYPGTHTPTPPSVTSSPASKLTSPAQTAAAADASNSGGGRSALQDGLAAGARASSQSGIAAGGGAAEVVGLSEEDNNELDALLHGFTDAAAAVAEELQQLKGQKTRGGLFDGFLRTQPISKVNAGALVRTVELLQQRLRAAEQARDQASEQLFRAISSADANKKDMQAAQETKRALAELTRRCDMALELLGERNERIEQLEEDITDMKGIFRSQLEETVMQLTEARAEIQRLKTAAASVGVAETNGVHGHKEGQQGSEASRKGAVHDRVAGGSHSVSKGDRHSKHRA